MNVQFVRLDSDICGKLNQMAHQDRRTVSDLVNQMLREQLDRMNNQSAEGAASR